MASNTFRVLVLCVLSIPLAGCVFGSKSQLNGYVTAGAGAQAKVDAGQYVPNAMAQVAIIWNKRINHGAYPNFPNAMKLAQDYGIDCQAELHPQLAGFLQSALAGGAMYGAGGVTTGAGAGEAFGMAVAGIYAGYGVIADAGEGAVNGAVTGSYAQDAAIGECVSDFWEDTQKMNPGFFGLHIVTVYAGKNLGSWTPPDLSQPNNLDSPMTMPAELPSTGR
jgi:hypothetical protein